MSLINAGEGEFVIVYELRATPMDEMLLRQGHFGSGGEKDTVFAMRVTVVK